MKYRLALPFYVFLLMGGLRASSIPAFDVTGGTVDFTDFQYTIGNQFTTTQTISVTDLGVYSISGLTQSYEVGLWDSSGNLLASVTIPSTSEADQFVYVPITPISLAAGQTFQIGELINSTATWLAFPSFTSAPGIVFDDGVYNPTPSLANPTTDDVGPPSGSFGPSFEFTAVPEPATSWFLVPCLLLMLRVARKRA
jgi:hypothetical protein